MDAIRFLKQEHETAKEGFARIEQASRQERGAIWRTLRPELEIHEHIEEAGLYEPLGQDAKDRDTPLAEWKGQHAQEVQKAERLVRDIDAMDPEDEHWLTRVKELKAALAQHIEREEHEVFPRVALVWNRDRQERAGSDLERMKHDRSRRAA